MQSSDLKLKGAGTSLSLTMYSRMILSVFPESPSLSRLPLFSLASSLLSAPVGGPSSTLGRPSISCICNATDGRAPVVRGREPLPLPMPAAPSLPMGLFEGTSHDDVFVDDPNVEGSFDCVLLTTPGSGIRRGLWIRSSSSSLDSKRSSSLSCNSSCPSSLGASSSALLRSHRHECVANNAQRRVLFPLLHKTMDTTFRDLVVQATI